MQAASCLARGTWKEAQGTAVQRALSGAREYKWGISQGKLGSGRVHSADISTLKQSGWVSRAQGSGPRALLVLCGQGYSSGPWAPTTPGVPWGREKR